MRTLCACALTTSQISWTASWCRELRPCGSTAFIQQRLHSRLQILFDRLNLQSPCHHAAAIRNYDTALQLGSFPMSSADSARLRNSADTLRFSVPRRVPTCTVHSVHLSSAQLLQRFAGHGRVRLLRGLRPRKRRKMRRRRISRRQRALQSGTYLHEAFGQHLRRSEARDLRRW